MFTYFLSKSMEADYPWETLEARKWGNAILTVLKETISQQFHIQIFSFKCEGKLEQYQISENQGNSLLTDFPSEKYEKENFRMQ